MARILKADGAISELKGEDPKGRLTLEQMQQAVGGYVEVIRLPVDKLQMLVDEEGGWKDLPVNERATALYQVNAGIGRVIKGDVVLCDYRSLR
jgi:hypothetical protein